MTEIKLSPTWPADYVRMPDMPAPLPISLIPTFPQVPVKIKRKPGVPMPAYATDGSAGFDLVAAEDVLISPGETVIVPTGLSVELPDGYEMQVRPRSGISVKTKLRVQLGTVDSDFRGEIGVIVDNTHSGDYICNGHKPRYKTRCFFHFSL